MRSPSGVGLIACALTLALASAAAAAPSPATLGLSSSVASVGDVLISSTPTSHQRPVGSVTMTKVGCAQALPLSARGSTRGPTVVIPRTLRCKATSLQPAHTVAVTPGRYLLTWSGGRGGRRLTARVTIVGASECRSEPKIREPTAPMVWSIGPASGVSCSAARTVVEQVAQWADPGKGADLGASSHLITYGYQCVVVEPAKDAWRLYCYRGDAIVRGSTAR